MTEKEEKVKIRMAGFKVPRDRRKLIDRKEYINENGKIDYIKLVKNVDGLGERLMRENKIIELLNDTLSIRRRFRCIR